MLRPGRVIVSDVHAQPTGSIGMTLSLSLTLALAVTALCFGLLRSGFRTPAWARPHTAAGPDTLEELFAARYARGEIDFAQYRASVNLLAAQLHYRPNAEPRKRKKKTSCAS
ncbi:hypothetical protein CH262_20895 [Rhodococcus sp. 05-2255-1e]|nr:hypothetical protein ACG96_06525 [Rhodococcus fascians]OZC38512.1 hypothetical protein CHX23_20955 [Rhodococcus fascians]OZE21754.1 hypothetical protein CH262_20895 [Rhodococcus sp. 05-2255-1e]